MHGARRAFATFVWNSCTNRRDEVQRVTTAFQAFLAGRINAAKLGSELKRHAPAGVTEGSLFVPQDFERFPILQ